MVVYRAVPEQRRQAWRSSAHITRTTDGKLRRCTERSGELVGLYLYLAATLLRLGMLIRRASSRYRWDGRPTTRRLK
jgi:hypothetical protein